MKKVKCRIVKNEKLCIESVRERWNGDEPNPLKNAKMDNTAPYIYATTFVPSMVSRYGNIKRITYRVVYENDKFMVIESRDQNLIIITRNDIYDSIDNMPSICDTNQAILGGTKISYFYKDPQASPNWNELVVRFYICRPLRDLFATYGLEFTEQILSDSKYTNIIQELVDVTNSSPRDIHSLIARIREKLAYAYGPNFNLGKFIYDEISMYSFKDGNIRLRKRTTGITVEE